MENWEKRMNRALKREGGSSWPSGVSEDIIALGDKIDEVYDGRNYGSKNPPPDTWEIAAQTVSKLKAVAGNSTKRRLQEKYEKTIRAFDLESGSFPSNFDPQTGSYLKK